MNSLSTLRSESRLSPRKTRFRLLARLYRTGLVTRRASMKGFTFYNDSPFPSFLAQYVSWLILLRFIPGGPGEAVSRPAEENIDHETHCAKKLGKGESSQNVKPFIETLRVTNPVRQSRASSRKRVLRGERRLSLRSVDSEFKRCVIEPRNCVYRGEPSSLC